MLSSDPRPPTAPLPRGQKSRRRGAALALSLLLALAASGSARSAEEARPYRPIPAELGAAATPPADLTEAARRLHAAATAGDEAAVFALLAARVSLITSGLTAASHREAEQQGPWPQARAALAAIGGLYLEGDRPAAGATDLAAAQIAQALAAIADATAQPEWGRDPLVKDGICTYRGARWRPRSTADDGARGVMVQKPTPVSASPDAPGVAGTLKPGLIYLEGELDDLPEGWRAVRLPTGRVGVVRESAVREPGASGLCFARGADGQGWRVVAFSSVLL